MYIEKWLLILKPFKIRLVKKKKFRIENEFFSSRTTFKVVKNWFFRLRDPGLKMGNLRIGGRQTKESFCLSLLYLACIWVVTSFISTGGNSFLFFFEKKKKKKKMYFFHGTLNASVYGRVLSVTSWPFFTELSLNWNLDFYVFTFSLSKLSLYYFSNANIGFSVCIFLVCIHFIKLENSFIRPDNTYPNA